MVKDESQIKSIDDLIKDISASSGKYQNITKTIKVEIGTFID